MVAGDVLTPLPEIKSLLAGEVRPCPGCGEPMFLTSRKAMKPPMLVCQNEINCHFSQIEILPREYEKVFCWQLVSELVERVERSEQDRKVLQEQMRESVIYTLKLESKIEELEKELEKRK